MLIFGYRFTKDPPLNTIQKIVHTAIRDVVSPGLNGGLPDMHPNWDKIIGKPAGGGDPSSSLGFDGPKAWAPLAREIIEKRLYRHETYGPNFRAIVLTEPLVEAQLATSLRGVEYDFVMTTVLGKPKSGQNVA